MVAKLCTPSHCPVCPQGTWNESHMAEGVEHLLARTFRASGADAAPAGVRELAVDFVVGAHAGWQMTHVRRYFEQPGDWRQRTLLVLSLCVWEQKHVQPW